MTPRRVQLRRTKGWRKPPNTVVVSRPSKWGNPYKVGGDYGAAFDVSTPAKCVEKYRFWLQGFGSVGMLEYAAPLRGKNLACWCPLGSPCHADVLLEIANAVTT